jgi:M6 family metalloprotease-like protein
VVRDPKTGEFCYARVAGNGADIVSTGVRVGKTKPAGLKPKQRLTGAAAMEKSRLQRVLLGKDENGRLKPELRDKLMPLKGKGGKKNADGTPAVEEGGVNHAPSDGTTGADGGTQFAPPTGSTVGERRGLVMLVAFPDRPGDITKTPQEIDRLFNDPAYADGGNATSVYGYFDIQSGGKLKYTNAVTAWFTAKRERAYYTDETRPNSEATRELINEGLSALSAGGFDFSQCDADSDGVIDAVNCLYAGQRINAWSKGLWPQQSSHSWAGFSAYGLNPFYQYQISDTPVALTIGTIMHENGHMICDYPDLYTYLSDRAAELGNYSLMSGYDSRHPQNIDPYLKIASGWANVIDITSSSVLRGAVQVGANHFYRFRNPSKSSEYFLIEARGNTGYEGPYGGAATGAAPTSGLVVYHAMQTGSNTGSSIITGASPVIYSTPYE